MAVARAGAREESVKLPQVVGRCSKMGHRVSKVWHGDTGASLKEPPTGQRWDDLSIKMNCPSKMLKPIKSQGYAKEKR